MLIRAHTYISPKGAFKNGKLLSEECTLTEQFLKQLYLHFHFDYPKFHKMDGLSKSVFIASELMHNELNEIQNADSDLQLIFANAQSSLLTDNKFVHSYLEQGNPSPSLFVYTLPNITTGELAIRNKWFGENVFFIRQGFDAAFFAQQVGFSFSRGNTHVLLAWVEINGTDEDECFMCLIEKNKEQQDITEELNNWINTYRK